MPNLYMRCIPSPNAYALPHPNRPRAAVSDTLMRRLRIRLIPHTNEHWHEMPWLWLRTIYHTPMPNAHLWRLWTWLVSDPNEYWYEVSGLWMHCASHYDTQTTVPNPHVPWLWSKLVRHDDRDGNPMSQVHLCCICDTHEHPD